MRGADSQSLKIPYVSLSPTAGPPWAITDYEGAGIEPRHMDHLGFRVENLENFKRDLAALVNRNPALSPKPGGTEGNIRLKLLAQCKHGQFQLADPDGVPIDVAATH